MLVARFSVLVFIVVCALPLAAQNVCPAEIEFTNPRPTVSNGVLELNLFTTVSKPASNCLPAEIRLMAAFYDEEQNLVCSGVIESIATQNSNSQSTNIEVRPLNMVEFAKLRLASNPPPKRLFCMNPEGNVEVAPTELARAKSLRLRATILPKAGGVATSEVRINF